MSGPTTAFIVANPVALLLSAATFMAARRIAEGHKEGAQLQQGHASKIAAQLAAKLEAAALGQHALAEQVAAAESAFRHLVEHAGQYGAGEQLLAAMPSAPVTHDHDNVMAYLRTLLALNE